MCCLFFLISLPVFSFVIALLHFKLGYLPLKVLLILQPDCETRNQQGLHREQFLTEFVTDQEAHL